MAQRSRAVRGLRVLQGAAILTMALYSLWRSTHYGALLTMALYSLWRSTHYGALLTMALYLLWLRVVHTVHVQVLATLTTLLHSLPFPTLTTLLTTLPCTQYPTPPYPALSTLPWTDYPTLYRRRPSSTSTGRSTAASTTTSRARAASLSLVSSPLRSRHVTWLPPLLGHPSPALPPSCALATPATPTAPAPPTAPTPPTAYTAHTAHRPHRTSQAGQTLADLSFLCAGAGSAGLGVCEQIVDGMVEAGLSKAEARARFVVCTSVGALGKADGAHGEASTPPAPSP